MVTTQTVSMRVDDVNLRRMEDEQTLSPSVVRHSLLTGVGLGVALALFVTAIELINDPGGVFWQDGTLRWDNAIETAWSWFFPVFLASSFVAFLVVHGLRLFRNHRSNKS